MKKVVGTFLFIGVLFLCAPVHAQKTLGDQETTDICNTVMMNIYHDILAQKDKFPQLAGFGESALYENQYGMVTIVYEYKESAVHDPRRQPFYGFAITINKMDDQFFSQEKGVFNYNFPALGIKFSGYFRRHLIGNSLNILNFIDERGVLIAEHQQKYLPLQLIMRPVQEKYYAKEEIEFELILRNISKGHMMVKSLGKETLYFLINNQYWGTKPSSDSRGGDPVILEAGKELTMRFKGEVFQRPQEVEIHGVYRMSINDVHPFAVLKIKVHEK